MAFSKTFFVVSGILLTGVEQSLGAQQQYTIELIPKIDGNFNPSIPAAINSSGEVVGTALGNSAFIYQNGVTTDLNAIIGGVVSTARAINDEGDIVGAKGISPVGNSGSVAYLYSNGQVTTFAPPADTLYTSSAEGTGINAAGQIVVRAQYAGSDPNLQSHDHAFLYDHGTWTDVGSLGGSYVNTLATGVIGEQFGTGINASGTIVGYSITASPGADRAFTFDAQHNITNLGTLPGAHDSFATAVNDNGQVVGVAGQAVLYDAAGNIGLGTLPAPFNNGSRANDINNLGVIVGNSDSPVDKPPYSHAFIYENGVMTDLNSLIDPASGWTLSDAIALNDKGQIVGLGYLGSLNNLEGFVLTPVPEPATLCLLVPGLALLGRRKKHF